VILKTKVGKFLTDGRIFSENNPPIPGIEFNGN
jgi:hypothetical protein